MVHYRSTSRPINRSADDVFNIIGTHSFDNHPKWEEDVVEVRQLTPPPMSVGSRAVMVRNQRGKRNEFEYEVVGFEPGHRIAIHQNLTDTEFDLSFVVRSLSTDTSDITADLTMKLHGIQRLFEPLIAVGIPARSKRFLAAMAVVAETASTQPDTPSSAPSQ